MLLGVIAAVLIVTVPGVPLVPPNTASLRVVQRTLFPPVSFQTRFPAVVFQLPEPSAVVVLPAVLLSASKVNVAADARIVIPAAPSAAAAIARKRAFFRFITASEAIPLRDR